MIYLGVDPGKSGAIAALDDVGHVLDVWPMPLVKSQKGRDEYDLAGIAFRLRECKGLDAFFTVERPGAMPPMKGTAAAFSGSLANYNRGVCNGWFWMLTALGIPHQAVSPQTWQAAMLARGAGDTGQRSILAAKQLWPLQSLLRTERSRKDDDGMADALLIAEWGRRKHRGALENVGPGRAVP